MNWLWLNVPLGSLIFLAVAGIPMWLVIKRPDTRLDPASPRRAALAAARVPAPAHVASGPRVGMAGRPRRPEGTRPANVLVNTR